MGGRNPRPCVCGHMEWQHFRWAYDCFECDFLECFDYRPVPRTEPLRVLQNPVMGTAEVTPSRRPTGRRSRANRPSEGPTNRSERLGGQDHGITHKAP
jgi:hypothetical protein